MRLLNDISCKLELDVSKVKRLVHSSIETTLSPYIAIDFYTAIGFIGGMENRKVSLVLTSCNRFDLLAPTLESFKKYNDYPLHQVIVIEDSGNETVRQVVKNAGFADAIVIVNGTQLGQIASIDKAYSQVTGEFIFHCEDDWEFYRPHFIQESIALLDQDPKLIQVAIRDRAEMYDWAVNGTLREHEGVAYRMINPDVHPRWFGYSFNPGLRRLAQYSESGSNFAAIGHENEISIFFKKRGYAMGVLEHGAVRHLGRRRTVRDPKHYRPITRIEKWRNSVCKRWVKLMQHGKAQG